ncbi:MAG: marine proteobacterial sortase target protein [Nitrospirales bacterium]|nr:MAG: marine proteobacterial sortase target protein [Nitrospirales bacterium]
MFTTDAYAESSTQHTSPHDATQGTLLFRSSEGLSYSPAPTVETNAHISITGLISRTIVRQTFQNPGPGWTEGIYVFPLPETAAVDHLRMHIGDRVIEGIIQERAQAKQTYSTAKREGKRTSLIEQERPNMFTASVANIGPHETIMVEIEYQETVRYERETFSLRFPMVVGPRYIPGTPVTSDESLTAPTRLSDGHGWATNTHQVPDASRITPPVQHPNQKQLNPITLTIDLAPGFPLAKLASTYHDIHHISNNTTQHQITLQEGNVPADRDFELIWEAEQEHTPKMTVFSEHFRDETYMMLMLMPPSHMFADHVALPRDVTFVIDTSGSMHGSSIEQAKLALQLALTRLTEQDRFNVIQFNHVTEALFSSSQPVTTTAIQQATLYVKDLHAEGGTEMLPALTQAFVQHDPTTYIRQVVFITDGQIGNEQQLFKAIQNDLADTRLFTIGIGSAPNSYFMRHAAKFGRGTFTYIGRIDEVQDKMNHLFHALEHPVLTDIDMTSTENSPGDITPDRIPDLYVGEPLMIAIRTEAGSEQLHIKGKIGSKVWEKSISLHDALQRRGIATYWARQKIMTLMDDDMKKQENSPLRQEIINVAMDHHLVSRYTSLVAVDVTPVRSSDQTLAPHAIKTNLPHGQDYTAIFGLAAGGTSGPWHFTVGSILLLLAWASMRYHRSAS